MKKQKSRAKSHSRKSGKSRMTRRKIQKPIQNIRSSPPDNLLYPDEVSFIYFYEEDIIAVFKYLGLSSSSDLHRGGLSVTPPSTITGVT